MNKWIVLLAVTLTPAWAQLPPIPGGDLPPIGEQEVVSQVDYSEWYMIAAEALGTTGADLANAENSVLIEARMAGVHPVRPLIYIFMSEYSNLRSVLFRGELSRAEARAMQQTAFYEMVKFLFYAPDQLAEADPEAAVARWEQFAIENYELFNRLTCECLGIPAYQSLVQDGVLQDVQVLTMDWVETPAGEYVLEVVESAAGDLNSFSWLTAEGLIARALSAVEQQAEYVNIKYHPIYGYVSDLYIDFSSFIADEELIFDIELTPLANQ